MAAVLGSLQNNDQNSFVLVNGEVARRVTAASSGNILEGVVFDCFIGTKPDAVTEVFEYKTGGISGTTTATVTITYEDSTKEFVTSAVKT